MRRLCYFKKKKKMFHSCSSNFFFFKRSCCMSCKPDFEQPLEPSKIAQISASGAMDFQKRD